MEFFEDCNLPALDDSYVDYDYVSEEQETDEIMDAKKGISSEEWANYFTDCIATTFSSAASHLLPILVGCFIFRILTQSPISRKHCRITNHDQPWYVDTITIFRIKHSFRL